MTSYDAIIIGTGQAGPALADRLSRAGQRVAIIERARFGGTCVNTGCIPTKAMVASAYAARMAQRAAEYGVVLPGPPGVDMRQVKARKDAISGKSRVGVESWLRGLENCTVIQGQARLAGPRRVQVGDETLTAERIFLNVGGRAAVPPMPGIQEVPFLTNSTMMDLDTLPEHLVVVGGSYIGLEFGQIFRRFGSQVTIIEQGPRLIGREDEDVSAAIAGFLEKEGIAIRTSAKCMSVARQGDGVAVAVDCTAGAPVVTGSHLLLAVGRRPNTADLGLEAAGVATDERGYITVDDALQTSVPGIWALGDCNGRGAFTHTSYNDFEIVAANLLDGETRRVTDRIPAYALFTDPPLGRAGMTEAEARRSGRRILVAKRPMTRVGRAVEKGETEGFMKVVVDAGTRQILGAAILGTGGDEVVHGLLDLMYAKAPYDVLQRSMPIHPTVSELLPTALGSLEPAT
ncbi:FAD-containing oxidoreductase [Inquilinus limosus]|uniref:FAD-containing oxidoreductase n=1 Tax=Inquilinus limosus TaxID=171674 RepID=UPI0004024B49|nr:FAD-containing oxidoreductase [Inquilinus limosus]